jgi:glycosyltransferase involved in cell wall biosynthesis
MARRDVDILLTYWGDFSLLKEAIDSVINQTYDNWHLWVIDDCYPSSEAADYAAQLNDPRITYIRHSQNLGITKNFNYALQKATAEYCIFLGCDDRLLPDYLATAVKEIGKADFFQPGVQVINENGETFNPLPDRIKYMLRPARASTYDGQRLIGSLCMGNWLYFPSILWRTEVIKSYGFDEKYKIVEDLILEFNLIADGHQLALCNTKLFEYRRSSQSLSSKDAASGSRFHEEDEMYRNFSKRFKNLGWHYAAAMAYLRPTSRLHKMLAAVSRLRAR